MVAHDINEPWLKVVKPVFYFLLPKRKIRYCPHVNIAIQIQNKFVKSFPAVASRTDIVTSANGTKLNNVRKVLIDINFREIELRGTLEATDE
jgi:hypothetical protein